MRTGRTGKGQFHNRPNIALRLAAVMLMLVCISIWMLQGLFAKYRTSSSGEDSARVMSFGNITLTETGDFGTGGGTAYLIPGVDLKKDVSVEFTGSESATYVFVEVELPAHWSSGDNIKFSAFTNRVKWSVADNWTYLKLQDEPTTEFVYYCEVPPNTSLEKKPFIAGGKITVDSTLTKKDLETIAGLPEALQINLRAIVVQSNGFASPEAAWASVAN